MKQTCLVNSWFCFVLVICDARQKWLDSPPLDPSARAGSTQSARPQDRYVFQRGRASVIMDFLVILSILNLLGGCNYKIYNMVNFVFIPTQRKSKIYNMTLL